MENLSPQGNMETREEMLQKYWQMRGLTDPRVMHVMPLPDSRGDRWVHVETHRTKNGGFVSVHLGLPSEPILQTPTGEELYALPNGGTPTFYWLGRKGGRLELFE